LSRATLQMPIAMRTSIPPDCKPAQGASARRSRFRCEAGFVAIFAASALLFLAPWPCNAQTAAAPSSPAGSAPAQARKPVHRKKPSAAHLVTPAAAVPEKPPEPETPDWPVNDKPGDASVVWDSQGLRIEAQNSSLQQILNDVAAATGATVEGLDTDERIFGAYGPGQARVVLSQLLEGSGYNVIMIGDQGQGTPRQILLSSRSGAGKAPAAGDKPGANEAQPPAADEDPDADDPDAPPVNRPRPIRPRNPQQILEEMQQRQQRQQNQQGQPPANPQN
jgi:hypothetical protein